MHGLPTGGRILSESKFRLNPNGRCCGDVKARNSGGRSGGVPEFSGTRLPSCLSIGSSTTVVVVAAAVVKAAMVVLVGFKEQEEFKVVEMKRVRRFEDKRRKRKKRFVERDLGL